MPHSLPEGAAVHTPAPDPRHRAGLQVNRNCSSWTTGTATYRSVKRGESNGCHRMHNYVVLRLAGFQVKHREHVRDGLVLEDYVRHLEYNGQEVALASESKGYRFKLTPPVPVTVLHDVHGNARATKSVVPLNVAP